MSHLRSNPVRTLRAALAAAALAWATATPVLAQEGNGGIAWSQFQRDAAHSGSLPDGPEPPFRQIWRFTPPEGPLSGAVVADGTAFAVGRQAVYGLDLFTGTVSWEIPRDGGRISMPAVGEGPGGAVLLFLAGPPQDRPDATGQGATPSPTTQGEGADEADRGPVSELVAVSLASREELWRTALRAESRSGVAVDGRLGIVADDRGTVYAIDLGTGSITWTAETAGRVEAPAAVADGRVFVVSRDQDAQQAELVALDAATGERAWRFTPQAGAVVASAPSAVDGSVVLGSADRLVRRLSAESGEVLWDSLTLTLFSPLTAPASSGDELYVADASGGVYRLDPADGSRGWEHQLNELIVRSAPVRSADHVLVGLNDGRLVALDPGNGDLVWDSGASQGLIGAIALSPEVVVAVKGGERPGLIALEHDPEGSLVRVPSPTVVDAGRLYGNYALALLIASMALYVPFRFLRSRMGPAFVEQVEEEEEDDLDGPEGDDTDEGALPPDALGPGGEDAP